jgi:hypothetical protein
MAHNKALEILGVISPSMASLAKPEVDQPSLVKTIIPGAAVGVAGYMLWKKHPVLGFFAGESLGLNAVRFVRNEGEDRTRALCNMGMTAAAVAGSLMWKKHPFWGFVVGLVVGGVATSFVPGSNAYKLRNG